MKIKKFGMSTKREQLSLGELIAKLEEFPRTCGIANDPVVVEFDFGTAHPTRLASFRGSYDQLELGYEWCGYDNNDEHFGSITVDPLLEELKNALKPDVYFTGWKGGDYHMNQDTPVWVSNPGNASYTGIHDVQMDYNRIILFTDKFED